MSVLYFRNRKLGRVYRCREGSDRHRNFVFMGDHLEQISESEAVGKPKTRVAKPKPAPAPAPAPVETGESQEG